MIVKIKIIVLLISLLNITACTGQQKKSEMTNKMTNTNPLLCDPDTGMCEIPNTETKEDTSKVTKANNKKVKLVYFTDPICSSCWGIEPQLRKLKLEYGKDVDIEYRMGGLLPDWSYNSGGISKPSDVAHHWDEVSRHYDMPIDGDIWLEDPLNSSYPPSIAFKAAQLQDEEKAQLFMREIREMVFLKKINIAKWENLAIAAKNVELNVKELKKDFDGKAKNLFEDDLKKAREYGVRGFPTIFFVDSVGHKEVVYGSKPYTNYESAILKINSTITKSEYGKNWETLFSKYNSLTAKEFSVISERPRIESEDLLNKLSENGNLYKVITKNGSIWSLVK
jgi:predicted DsbA family dithiol-disulfide isomerase